MIRPTQRTLAAVLAAAVIAMPSAALADSKPAPMPMPVPISDPAPDSKDPVSLAEVKITRDEAIAIAKKSFAIPADMLEPNANLSQSKQGAAWYLEWRTPSKQPNPRMISVSVNAVTGVVVSYNYSDQKPAAGELTYSRSEAQKVAGEWLDKLAAGQKESLRFVDDPLQNGFYGGNTLYRFRWDRMEQGYSVNGDGIDIVIDAQNGKLLTYGMNWRTGLIFRVAEPVLAEEKAMAAYFSQLPMQLQYQRFVKPGTQEGEWKLVYRPQFGFPMVSMEGKLLGWEGLPVDLSQVNQAKLVPAPEKPYVKPVKPLTMEEALAVAQAVAGRKDQPSDLNCSEYGEETKSRACTFNWSGTKEESNPNVQVDLETGVVLHFSDWGPWYKGGEPTASPKINLNQARQTAVDFIRQHRPDLAGKVLVTANENKDSEGRVYSYSVGFQMTHEFVPIAHYSSNMEIDPRTGRIVYYWGQGMPKNEEFPGLDGLIKPAQALESFMTHKGLELTWYTTYGHERMPGMAEAGMQKEPATQLVWQPKSILPVEVIDAKTAALYDYNGRDLVEMARRPEDIEGHVAQREIELLWARGIFELKGGKFNPDQPATAGDLAQWLVMVRGYQPYYAYDYAMSFGGAKAATGANFSASPQAQYLGAALQNGILLPEDFDEDADPSEPVSRELFALWAARALGYGDIAKMENAIAMNFSDKAQVGGKYANAVAILNGLKIVRSDAFRPQATITRAEAAQILLSVSVKGQIYPFWK